MYRKKTLRHMQPYTRRHARLINDLDSVLRRLTNFTTDLARLELEASALFNKQMHEAVMKQIPGGDEPSNLDEFMSDYFDSQDKEADNDQPSIP